MAFVPPQIESTYRPFSVDSLCRAPRIERVLKHSKEATSPEATRALIAEALRDHFGYPNSVCNHPDERDEPLKQNQTIASNIVDLTSGEYYLAAGTPCDTDYVKLPWNLYDQAAEPPSHAGGPARSTRNGRTAANGRAVGAARQ
jgi:isopenicillin-N N-acyltransferase-like protein